jgi:hypothetical protein
LPDDRLTIVFEVTIFEPMVKVNLYWEIFKIVKKNIEICEKSIENCEKFNDLPKIHKPYTIE